MPRKRWFFFPSMLLSTPPYIQRIMNEKWNAQFVHYVHKLYFTIQSAYLNNINFMIVIKFISTCYTHAHARSEHKAIIFLAISIRCYMLYGLLKWGWNNRKDGLQLNNFILNNQIILSKKNVTVNQIACAASVHLSSYFLLQLFPSCYFAISSTKRIWNLSRKGHKTHAHLSPE